MLWSVWPACSKCVLPRGPSLLAACFAFLFFVVRPSLLPFLPPSLLAFFCDHLPCAALFCPASFLLVASMSCPHVFSQCFASLLGACPLPLPMASFVYFLTIFNDFWCFGLFGRLAQSVFCHAVQTFSPPVLPFCSLLCAPPSVPSFPPPLPFFCDHLPGAALFCSASFLLVASVSCPHVVSQCFASLLGACPLPLPMPSFVPFLKIFYDF